MSRFYLTTAIDYVNSRPHLGTAYEKVTADVIARYRRLCGLSTLFLMGNDEHSQNVFQRAKELGLDPRAYCDQMEDAFREAWATLEISFDDFIRTTQDRHRVAVTALVQRIAEAGDLYEGFYEGWYCVSCEAFKQEKDLVNGECPIHLTAPQWIKEKNYFFRLSKYQRALLDHFEAHPEFLEPAIRRNEILRLIEGGLEDISVSRTGQAWGIPLPFDPTRVVYVWVDALINYISAVGYGADETQFRHWWPADLHIIGKDITRFHSVVWPAMLMSAGLPLPRKVFGHGWMTWKGQRMSKSLGTAIDPITAADRFGPDPLRLYLVKEIPFGQDGDFTWKRYQERYNVDLANNFGNLLNRVAVMAHRYRQGTLAPPKTGPGPLAHVAEDTVKRYTDAMNSYALHDAVSAVFTLIDATNEFIARSEPWVVAKDPARTAQLERQLFDMAEAVRIAALLLSPVMPTACAEILTTVGETRRVGEMRLDRDAVWSSSGERFIVKRDPMWPRVEAEATEDTGVAAQADALAEPTQRDRGQATAERRGEGMTDGRASPAAGEASQKTPLEQSFRAPSEHPTSSVAQPLGPGSEQASVAQPLRPASEQASVARPLGPGSEQASVAQPFRAGSGQVSAQGAPTRISYEDFAKVELRVAKIVSAEPVPKSKKLLKLEVDLGSERRTLVAGIAGAYAPDTLVGRTVIVVANLQPAKLMGVESNGMVLAASTEDGTPVLLTLDKAEAAPPGSKVK